jgi:uncharacterized cupredoxin-like copper-binding protein
MKQHAIRTITAISVVLLAFSACTTGQPSATPPSPAGPTAVQVTLQEWSIVPSATSAAAGAVTFQVKNTGPEDIHEFVVLKTDLDPGALPVDANGAVTEEGAGIEVVDEIEDIPVGQTQTLNVTLQAGKYVLLCNIYSESENEAHYKLGMRTAFQVTGP